MDGLSGEFSRLHTHLPFPTYYHQPRPRLREGHHVQASALPPGCLSQVRLRPSFAGSSYVTAVSCSLALRSIGFPSRCFPPRLAATQLRLSYQLYSWFMLCRVSHPAGVCCLTAHERRPPVGVGANAQGHGRGHEAVFAKRKVEACIPPQTALVNIHKTT